MLLQFVCLLAACNAVQRLQAKEITLQSIRTGYVFEGGFPTAPGQTNYIVGKSGGEYRNFSMFDFSDFSQTVLYGVLRFHNVSDPPYGGNGFSSRDDFETFSLYDADAHEIQRLVDVEPDNRPLGMSVFEDLGSGAVFGKQDVDQSYNGHFVQVALNSEAISALNSADASFAFGGAITTIRPVFRGNELIFGWSHEHPDVHLILGVVPEPVTATIVILAVVLSVVCKPSRDCP